MVDDKAPRFLSGSMLRHVLIMTGTGAIGLMAIFLGDFVNLLFLGMLGDTEILAAVGYASTILFFAVSMGIGLSIGATAVVSPAIGARDTARARQLATSAHVVTFGVSVCVCVLLWFLVPSLLTMLGASGRTHQLAALYLRISLPSMPLLALGMCSGAILRSLGDAQRAMYTTLAGAVINVALDPILIFWMKLDLVGAALASVVARVGVAVVGLLGVVIRHRFLERPRFSQAMIDARPILAVAVPAVLTNLATPAANALTTAMMARHGDAAVAAWTIFGRINPVAFGAVFALSASIGPIVGQNLGAQQFDRVREAIGAAIKATIGFTLLAWLFLALSAPLIVTAFSATEEVQALVLYYCRWLPPLFAFLGALFVANAIFNTLRHPHYATFFNWGRATIGTVPFVWIGGQMAGAAGVITGSLVGAVFFGLGALWMCYRVVDKLENSAV